MIERTGGRKMSDLFGCQELRKASSLLRTVLIPINTPGTIHPNPFSLLFGP